MTFQYIINHLHEPHLWCIVLTAPHAELNIQKKLEQQGFITYEEFYKLKYCSTVVYMVPRA